MVSGPPEQPQAPMSRMLKSFIVISVAFLSYALNSENAILLLLAIPLLLVLAVFILVLGVRFIVRIIRTGTGRVYGSIPVYGFTAYFFAAMLALFLLGILLFVGYVVVGFSMVLLL